MQSLDRLPSRGTYMRGQDQPAPPLFKPASQTHIRQYRPAANRIMSRESLVEMRKKNQSAKLRSRPLSSEEERPIINAQNRTIYQSSWGGISRAPILTVQKLESSLQNELEKLLSKNSLSQSVKHETNTKKDRHYLYENGDRISRSNAQIPKRNRYSYEPNSTVIPNKFSPKMSKKSLQDNPLILGSIIRKKLQVLEKNELDAFLANVIGARLPH